MELRPYQQESIDSINRQWEKVKNTLLVLPTGCGKTIVFCKLIEQLVAQGGRCLILAHRGELLEQAADKMKKATGLDCAVEKAKETALKAFERITVGSVQSLMQQKRLDKFDQDFYSHIIVDEAHHAISNSYMRVLNHFSDAKILGVTATPDRGDMQSLGDLFESIAYEYSLPRAIKEGYLCKIKALTVPLNIDLAACSVRAGDYKAEDVGNALDPYLDQIAIEMSKTCKDRKTVVFTPLIATSKKMQSILKEHGMRVAEVNGESKDRKQILQDFDDDKYDVLLNSMLLTEGWDCTSVDCVVVLRPTKIRSLYAQMVGRGTRLHPGKDHLLLLDFLWQTSRHELARPAHLIAESQEVANKMIKNMTDETGVEIDLEEALEQGEGDAIQEREDALAKQLSLQKKKKRKLVDPLQFEMSIMDAELATYEPPFGKEEKPNQEQKDFLENAGIFADEIQFAGKAQKMIDSIQVRRREGKTTPRQIRCLERYGFQHVGKWQFEEASNMIDRISATGWRLPTGVKPKEYKPDSLQESKGRGTMDRSEGQLDFGWSSVEG